MYEMFSGAGTNVAGGNKPFIITETGATYHLHLDNGTYPNPGPGITAIKQSWWRQFLDPSFLAQYPKIKAVSSFEFIKHEETSWRDFTVMGFSGNFTYPSHVPENASNETISAFRADMANAPILWANKQSFLIRTAASDASPVPTTLLLGLVLGFIGLMF